VTPGVSTLTHGRLVPPPTTPTTLLGGPTELPADDSRKEPGMPEHRGQFKKSAIDATSVTMVPSTASPSSMGEGNVSEIVVSTNGATPPVSFWGSEVADGIEFVVVFQRRS
jgi:hypothetical protein